MCGAAGCDDGLTERAAFGASVRGQEFIAGEVAGEDLLAAWTLPASSPGRVFLRKLNACSLLLSRQGASAGAGIWPALLGAAGLWKNLCRACWVLVAEGLQAGGSTAPRDAELEPSLVRAADTLGGPRPWGMAAAQGSGTLWADQELFATGLWAGDVHPAGELLVTRVLALLCSKRPPAGPEGSLGPSGLPTRMGQVVAGGSDVVRGKPFSVALSTAGCWADGRAFGGAPPCPFISWAFCRMLGGPKSTEVGPGCLEAMPKFAEVALE